MQNCPQQMFSFEKRNLESESGNQKSRNADNIQVPFIVTKCSATLTRNRHVKTAVLSLKTIFQMQFSNISSKPLKKISQKSI